jgi:SAM-dependent methyltransferase
MGEPQYDEPKLLARARKPELLGLMSGWTWRDDPKRLAFTLARYKFVAKMLEGRRSVLEIGCGDGWASQIVRQAVHELVAVDMDADFIHDARTRQVGTPARPIEYRVHDVLRSPPCGKYVKGRTPEGFGATFDGVFCLDVLEHIPRECEGDFISNGIAALTDSGAAIFGMPSLESQAHASEQSRAGHVNCKTQADFAATMRAFFDNVFMFSMNDEVVHTGFGPMSHYNIALCCGRR